jgi:hypothetical protein
MWCGKGKLMTIRGEEFKCNAASWLARLKVY